MQMSDIGVVDHARQRFREYASSIYEGFSEEALEERLKESVLKRFHDQRWTKHILDDGQEAWAVRMIDAPMFEGLDLTAVVKGDDRNPDRHRVVVTFLTAEATEKKVNLGYWQPFNKKIAIPRDASAGFSPVARPLTHTLGDKLKAVALEEPQMAFLANSPTTAPTPTKSPEPTRLVTYEDGGDACMKEVVAVDLAKHLAALVEDGIDPETVRVWVPLKTKKVTRIEVEE